MRTRTLLAATLAAVAIGAAAGTATSATTALTTCGTVAAAHKTWHVQAVGVKCAAARTIVSHVAVKKPDHVVKATDGEIDQFVAPFSGLKCFRTRKGLLGSINCSSSDYKKSVYAIYKP